MRASDKDALICDFAQYYHIYDIDALVPQYAAVLACGLPEDSRIRRSMSDVHASPEEILLAMSVDALNLIIWILGSRDEANIPRSVVKVMTGMEAEQAVNHNVESFDSPEAFEAAWRSYTQE